MTGKHLISYKERKKIKLEGQTKWLEIIALCISVLLYALGITLTKYSSLTEGKVLDIKALKTPCHHADYNSIQKIMTFINKERMDNQSLSLGNIFCKLASA